MEFEIRRNEVPCAVYNRKVVVERSYQLLGGLDSAEESLVHVGDCCTEINCSADCPYGFSNILERPY